MAVGQVSISSEFFKKERYSAYSDWREAFWRENFQNSIDAGSRTITVQTTQLEEGLVRVEFFDDGCGMSRQVLDEVYFDLGRSTKTDGETVGGFGRARMLTCFGMKRYAIATLTHRVEGSGSHYEISEGDFVQGCQLTIDVDESSKDELDKALSEYLRKCQPQRCEVRVGGTSWTQWTARGRLARDLEHVQDDETREIFAKVYVTKKAATPQVIVRVHGAAMYSVNTNAKALVVVEIEPALARQVLTSNRDGMTWRYRSVLNDFLEELTVNTSSSLKPRFAPKNTNFEGAGWIMASAFVKDDPDAQSPQEGSKVSEIVALHHEHAPMVEAGTRVGVEAEAEEGLPASSEQAPQAACPRETADLAGQCFATDLPYTRLWVETENAAVHRSIARYDPKNWVWVRGKDGKLTRSGGDIYKILRAWTVCVREAVRALLRARPNTKAFYYGVGWVFSDDAMATCAGGEEAKVFMLNPVDDKGALKFQLSSRASLQRMMAYAKHEVAHTLERWHDEDFARLLTEIDANFDERQVVSDLNREVRGC